MQRDEVLSLLRERFVEMHDRFAVDHISIFGSTVRGDAGPESDVDILVEFAPDARIGLFRFLELQEYLERILGRPVDLATPRALKDRMRDEVLAEAIRAA